MWQVDVHKGPDGLTAVADDWRNLLNKLPRERYFHNYGWWKAHIETLDPVSDSVSFFVVRNNGQAVAILPLRRRAKKWVGLPFRQWELPTHLHVPLNDILCDRDVTTDEVIAALRHALRNHESGGWDVLIFTGVMEESPLTKLAAGVSGPVIATLLKTCDYLACEGTYDEVTGKFSRNFRSNLNKARNKLARELNVEFTSVTDHAELPHSFSDFLDIEASGWKGAEGTGTAIKLHPDLMKFYQQLIYDFAPRGRVMINSLKVGGKVIASQFCLKDNDTLYILKLAYDENWSKVAPGNMLLERVIQEGILRKGFQYVNLVGDPPWFKDWQPDSQPVYNIALFNKTPAGLALFSAMKIKQWLRPFYYRYIRRNHAEKNSRP
jgi:CelD/BcsL family acetyltransferase involved in cellulose biosynthesis